MSTEKEVILSITVNDDEENTEARLNSFIDLVTNQFCSKGNAETEAKRIKSWIRSIADPQQNVLYYTERIFDLNRICKGTKIIEYNLSVDVNKNTNGVCKYSLEIYTEASIDIPSNARLYNCKYEYITAYNPRIAEPDSNGRLVYNIDNSRYILPDFNVALPKKIFDDLFTPIEDRKLSVAEGRINTLRTIKEKNIIPTCERYTVENAFRKAGYSLSIEGMDIGLIHAVYDIMMNEDLELNDMKAFAMLFEKLGCEEQ